MSPPSTAKYMATGIVSVFPGMQPANIKVAPNSPRALAKARIVPAAMPGKAKGTVIVQNILNSLTPKVLAAFKIFLSICSKAPLVVLYIKGKATTVAVITVADQEKINLTPKEDKNLPIGLFIPKINRRKKPKTVGGNIIGRVNKASNNILNLLFLFTINQAAARPRKKEMIVAAKEVFVEIHKGEKSKFKATHSKLYNYFAINEKPYFTNTALALSEDRNFKNAFASSAFLLFFNTAAG